MFSPDVLKFFNRLGVRSVNDVTAQVTVEVTAGMDPEGMGAHIGADLQVVEAVPFDQGAIIEAMTTVINTGNNSVMTHSTKLNETTMLHVDKVEEGGRRAQEGHQGHEGGAAGAERRLPEASRAPRARRRVQREALQYAERGAEADQEHHLAQIPGLLWLGQDGQRSVKQHEGLRFGRGGGARHRELLRCGHAGWHVGHRLICVNNKFC